MWPSRWVEDRKGKYDSREGRKEHVLLGGTSRHIKPKDLVLFQRARGIYRALMMAAIAGQVSTGAWRKEIPPPATPIVWLHKKAYFYWPRENWSWANEEGVDFRALYFSSGSWQATDEMSRKAAIDMLCTQMGRYNHFGGRTCQG